MASDVAPLDGTSLWKESTRTASNTLGKDDFLNLLVAQMKYQNPLEPMSNTESIAQLAQFSSLEQMTNIALSQNQGTAYSLVGKYVAGNLYSESTGVSEAVTGRVESVRISGSDIFLRLGEDLELPLSSVTHVTDGNLDALSTINSNIASSQSLALIGKNIQAIVTDSEGKITQFVEGTVDYVKIASGRTILMVNDMEIFAEEVLLVSDEKKLIGKPATGILVDSEGNQTEVPGTIKGIEFKDNKPYLVIGNEKFEIGAISDMTEALNLIGKNVDTSIVAGAVTNAVIKNGTVYVRVDGTDVSIEEVKKALGNKDLTKDTSSADTTADETDTGNEGDTSGNQDEAGEEEPSVDS